MRLDKFLKTSRIIKRRTIAKDVADQGKIEINGRVAKSSSNVVVGDKVTIHFATNDSVFEVLSIQDSTKKNDAELMYRQL
ncbi:RNA-binding S4 domain-containing protein [Lactobacillus sp. YT155]|uniref:RNA-binding S4 domain-containing protein n=1 Tax=Lactobacillus sp. YT155 TaxID=3060955 RepID=UPI00265E191B|nr:RNA-binding S4 domain-containing protein [Lactobacillus sp. YT155]MDO1604587.1 RNA-binding S4 domain-containing protein [Lactobacillus sp. YT155]